MWELYLSYLILWLSHCLGMDKTIATHTKGYVKSQYWLYRPMMWCYCYHLHAFQICEIWEWKIISRTPFVNKSPSCATTIAKNCNKVNKKVNMSIYDLRKISLHRLIFRVTKLSISVNGIANAENSNFVIPYLFSPFDNHILHFQRNLRLNVVVLCMF